MSTPMITEHDANVASILRSIESWLTGDGLPATRDERLESAYHMIAAAADEQHIPGATIDAALAEGVSMGLITAGEAERYTGFVNSPLVAEMSKPYPAKIAEHLPTPYPQTTAIAQGEPQFPSIDLHARDYVEYRACAEDSAVMVEHAEADALPRLHARTMRESRDHRARTYVVCRVTLSTLGTYVEVLATYRGGKEI